MVQCYYFDAQTSSPEQFAELFSVGFCESHARGRAKAFFLLEMYETRALKMISHSRYQRRRI